MQSAKQKVRISDQMEAAGVACFLSRFSSVHSKYTIAQMAHRLEDSIRNNRFRYYSTQENGPIGFCAWTYLSDETLEQIFQTGREIRQEEFGQGSNLFFVEMLAPFGHFKWIVRDLKKNKAVLFPNKKVGHSLRVRSDSASEECTFRAARFLF